MTKKIDVLGLLLDNYTVREAMMQVEAYMNDPLLHTIEVVTMQMLLEQENDAIVRDVISSLDLTVIGEKQILQAAGAETMQRMQETEADDFGYEFFRRVQQGKKSVFLLGENEDDLAHAEQKLEAQFAGILLTGKYALENCGGDFEAVINDINAMSPDIIVSVLPIPLQEHFLAEHREKMHTNIWYGIGGTEMRGKKRGVTDFFRSMLHMGRLKNSIDKYKQDEDIREL